MFTFFRIIIALIYLAFVLFMEAMLLVNHGLKKTEERTGELFLTRAQEIAYATILIITFFVYLFVVIVGGI